MEKYFVAIRAVSGVPPDATPSIAQDQYLNWYTTPHPLMLKSKGVVRPAGSSH